MRIVLIGGSGFIGKNLAVKLAGAGYEVLIYDRNKPNWSMIQEHKQISFIEGDFIKENNFSCILQEGDLIIYLVSSSYANKSNCTIYEDAKDNILTGIQFLEACRTKKISKIIFASSGGAIYGKPKEIPIKESHDTFPLCAYGISKLTMEKYLDLFQNLYDIPYISLRLANPYGIGQIPFHGQGVIATFLASILLDKKIQVWGDGRAIRDYIYIDDLSEAFLKAVEYKGKYSIFNIGSGIGYSINDIIHIISNAVHKNFRGGLNIFHRLPKKLEKIYWTVP